MQTDQQKLKFLLNMSLVQASVARSFDLGLGNGIGFNDFLVLYHLNQAADKKLRRIDLAEKISLTPSGVARMLKPMEKIGLVAKEESASDGRVSYVKLAPGGERLLLEAMERAEMISDNFLLSTDISDKKDISEVLKLFRINPDLFC
jgi:DNA-binding MarR family transcriptional regulator